MLRHLVRSSSPVHTAGGTRLPAVEALRIAAQLTDSDEDLHAITRTDQRQHHTT
ncbi:hypothetical protein BH23GEM9_BH23GEM9_07640 [soil metagenome]